MNSLIQDTSSLGMEGLTSQKRTHSFVSGMNSLPGLNFNSNTINNETESVNGILNLGEDSDKVVEHILKMNLGELLELAEGVGEFGEYEAYSEGPQALEEFSKQQEKS